MSVVFTGWLPQFCFPCLWHSWFPPLLLFWGGEPMWAYWIHALAVIWQLVTKVNRQLANLNIYVSTVTKLFPLQEYLWGTVSQDKIALGPTPLAGVLWKLPASAPTSLPQNIIEESWSLTKPVPWTDWVVALWEQEGTETVVRRRSNVANWKKSSWCMVYS